MTNLEIPFEENRSFRYRLFEILPGALSWSMLAAPIVLSFINATIAVLFVLAYILIFFTRTAATSVRALFGYHTMRQHIKAHWNDYLVDVEAGRIVNDKIPMTKWHANNMARLAIKPPVVKPSELIHAVIIAVHNETRQVVEPSIRAVTDLDYDVKGKVIFILAYEGRAGERTEKQSKALLKKYKHHFRYAIAIKHPLGLPHEVKGKGGNLTFAGRWLKEYVKQQGIDPLKVVVTTLDSDHRPHKVYLSALSYLYCVSPDPERAAYQPLPMFTNNIWDAPAPMRVIATGNNHYYIVLTQRPHMERNFASHAQCLKPLIEMDFWSTLTIVEDGHHFWRSYFHFDGDYRVHPLAIPIYQDAVLADTYLKTLKAQFIQLRRWTYGASDIAYIAHMGFFRKNKVPKIDLIGKFSRALEGHVSWASGALILGFAAFVPALINPESYAAIQLPFLVSRIQTIGLLGLMSSLFVALKTLPPRPARYKRHRSLFMVLQWLYMPITTIAYGASAALYSQTRLMFGWYLTRFDVTDKSVKQ